MSKSWGDALIEKPASTSVGKIKLGPDGSLPPPEVTIEGDSKKVVTYTETESGAIAKRTTIYKTETRTIVASQAVLDRRTWKKFGACAGLPPGPDAVTSVSDDVFIVLHNKLDDGEKKVDAANPTAPKAVLCRICKGEHWTSKCPFKDSGIAVAEEKSVLNPEDFPSLEVKGAGAGAGAAAAPAPGSASVVGGKYVPPSKKHAAAAGSDSTSDRDENTVHVTNLSDSTTETDVRELFKKFGYIQRLHMPKHFRSGLPRGDAYVSFGSKDDAANAIAKLHGHRYDHLILNVEWSKPKAAKS